MNSEWDLKFLNIIKLIDTIKFMNNDLSYDDNLNKKQD